MPSRLRVANGSSVRKPRKLRNRFRSMRMKKIEEEVKKNRANLQSIGGNKGNGKNGVTDKTYLRSNKSNYNAKGQRDNQVSLNVATIEQNLPKGSKVGQSDANAMKENFPPSSIGAKSRNVFSLEKWVTCTLKSSIYKTNASSKPLEGPHMSKMKQELVHNSNDTKRSTSQPNNLKAVPGLLHKAKRRSNFDQGPPISMHTDHSNGCNGRTNDGDLKDNRKELIPEEKPKSQDDNGNEGVVPHFENTTRRKMNKRRKYIDTNEDEEWMHNRDHSNGCNGRTNDGDFKGNMKELMLEEKSESQDDIGNEGVVPHHENPTRRKMNKRRKYIDINEDEEDASGDRSPQRVESDTPRLTSQDAILKDHAKVSMPLVPNCVKQQCYCCSKPIDEPIWSGILKIGSKECLSLAGHLSIKSGEKVWNLSKSLLPVVEVTKHSRSEVWPKRWEEASKPTNDNIALYFFPHKDRPDEYLDQLVEDVMENDLALRAVIDEAEMLIFPSSLLPKRYKRFQMKHYLWGVFKPREAEQGAALPHAERTIEATAVASNTTTTVPPQATGVATDTASTPTEDAANPTTVAANREQTDWSMGAPPGRMFGFVVRQTPRLEQLIREMKREGALVVAMQGEMMGAGSWLGCTATAMEQDQQSKV